MQRRQCIVLQVSQCSETILLYIQPGFTDKIIFRFYMEELWRRILKFSVVFKISSAAIKCQLQCQLDGSPEPALVRCSFHRAGAGTTARRSRLPKVKCCAPFVAKVDEGKAIRSWLKQKRHLLFSRLKIPKNLGIATRNLLLSHKGSS